VINIKKGDKYLSGYLDLGALGRRRVLIFKNENKDGENDPDHRIVVPTEDDEENNIQAGVLWVNKKGETQETEEKQKDASAF